MLVDPRNSSATMMPMNSRWRDSVGPSMRSFSLLSPYLQVCAAMAVVIDLLENPQQTAFQAVASSSRRHLQQEEQGETKPKQETAQYSQQPEAAHVQHQQKHREDEWDRQQQQREQQQHRSVESPRAKQGLRVPQPKRGTTWTALGGTGSNVLSLSSTATTTVHSPDSSLKEPPPVSATQMAPIVPSEGTFEGGQ